jgi:hypothetical protein
MPLCDLPLPLAHVGDKKVKRFHWQITICASDRDTLSLPHYKQGSAVVARGVVLKRWIWLELW